MGEVEKFCDEMKQDYKRMKHLLLTIIAVFGVATVLVIGNNMVLHSTVKQQGGQIDVIRKNYITYDNFYLFNRTYELQLEQTQSVLNGNNERVRELQTQYNELRSLIVTQRAIRGGQ